MNYKKRIFACLLVLVMLFSFVSCGEGETGNALSDGAASAEKTEGVTSGSSDKIIVEITVNALTDSFDSDYTRLKKEIAANGGYVANSSLSSQENNASRLQMTIKIPAEKATAFTDSLAEYLEIQSSNISTEDVTAEYIDMESRIAALESERDSLQAIMENTTDYDNMMVVSKRLYEVIAELESQKALLSSLSQKIAYSTVYLTLSESEEEVAERNNGFFDRIGRAFMNSLDFVGGFFTSLAVLVVGNLPTFLTIAAFVVLIVWIRKRRKKAKNKTEETNN